MPLDIKGLAPLIYVFDMPESVHFYRDLLGFELVATSGPGPSFGWALLRLNGVELMLNTAYEDEHRPLAPDPSRVAAHGDTALYFGCPDVDLAYHQLRALGLDVKETANTYYGMRQLHVKDPDGFALCLQWPVDGKWPFAEG